MKITRASIISGHIHTMEIDVTEEQLRRWRSGEAYIQDIMPNISADEREFIMSGITPAEWDAMFLEEDDTQQRELSKLKASYTKGRDDWPKEG